MYSILNRSRPGSSFGSIHSDAKVTSQKFAADDTIMFSGEGAGSIFLVRKGWVRLYRILQDDTQVLEIKNGPYVGAEADRKRL